MAKKQPKYGSVQERYVLLREVNGPLMRLDLPGGGSAYRSIVEITGTHLNLLDEQKQQDIHELYHRLFLSLGFPIQLIVRVQPLDIEGYLKYIDGPGGGDWQALALDHSAFLRSLSKQKPLLGRRFYLVLPAEEEGGSAAAPLPWLVRPSNHQEALSPTQAAQQLRSRYESVSYHLQSIGLASRLLSDKQLVGFYRSFFASAAMGLLPAGAALEDVVSPGVIAEQSDHISIEATRTEKQFVRLLKVEHLPRLVGFGWLKQLVECDETFDVVQHLQPKPNALAHLRRQQTHAHASVLFAVQKGRTTAPDASLASNDLAPLIDEVASGEQAMLNSSLHLLIRASSLEELEIKTRRVSQRAAAVFSRRPRVCTFEQATAFRSCLPGMLSGREPVLLPSSVVASMIPFFDHFVFKPSKTAILEGLTQHNEPVILDWWSDLPNANRLILGPSGWGKSYKAKLDILRIYYVYKRLAERERRQQDGFQILIVDPERETNRSPGFSLIERLGGQSIRLSPGSAHHLNPLDLPSPSSEDTDDREDLLANHIQRLHKILDLMLAHNVEDRNSTLMPGEKSLLDAALYETYRESGISSDRGTHHRPAPLLGDLYRVLSSEVCGPDTTNLAQRLRRYTEGSLSGLFSDATNIDLSNTVVQFDTKALDSELRPVALLMISQHIWNIAFASPLPRFLFIDELATVGRYKAGQQFLEEIFQRARKHYLSVTGMTQEAGHLTKSIIANCATHVLLHQDDTTIDYASELFKLSAREAQRVRGFERGEALMLTNGKRMMVRFAASKEEDHLITTNRRQINKLVAAAVASASVAPPVASMAPVTLVPTTIETLE